MEKRFILWFQEIDRHKDLALVGGKTANLAEMAKHLKVPPGFCLTVHAYREALKKWGIEEEIAVLLKETKSEDIAALEAVSSQIAGLFFRYPLPPQIEEALLSAYYRLGGGNSEIKVAVRSSATAEDLPEASFAGQQESFLNVSGKEELLAAVRRCWASLWTARAIHYRQRRGFDPNQVYMAVIVQEMLPAEVAGVMFTANPVSNSRQEILIEAVRGLGEALVSGQVTGDSYVVAKEGVRIKSKRISDERYGQLLPDEVIRELALTGIKIEQYYEDYQDVEWAYYKGELYYLQTRPITTLADEEPYSFDWDKLTFIQREILNHAFERYPDPIYPIDSVIVKITYSAYFKAMEEYGYFVPDMDWTRVEKGHFPDFFAPPRIRPGFRMIAFLPFKLWRALKTSPSREWAEERVYLLDILRKLAQREVDTLPYDIVYSYLNEALNQYHYFIVLRYRFFVRNQLPSFVLRFLLRLLFGAEGEDIRNDLLAGIDCITTEINAALWELARRVEASPRLREYFLRGDFTDFRRLLQEDEEGRRFLLALDEFLAAYGARETSMGLGGIASVTWEDSPEVVLGMIRGMIVEGLEEYLRREEKRRERVKKAEKRLWERLSQGWCRLLPRSFMEALIRHSKDFNAFRENSHYDVTLAMKVFKKLFTELGRRFARTGIIEKPEDIFYLTYYDIKDIMLILDQKHKKLNEREVWEKIERRREELQKRTVRWRNRWLTQEEEGEVLKGIAASQGIATGPARVITRAEDFCRLQPGDILVAPYTNPAWTPLFTVAAAVVVDTGGAASHAAIIAREYGIPAVMGTRRATSWVTDGEVITVDGYGGVVRREKGLRK